MELKRENLNTKVRKMIKFRLKFKPYDEFIKIMPRKLGYQGPKKAFSPTGTIFKSEKEPTKDDLKRIVAGLIDKEKVTIYDIYPHRIKDKDLEYIEVVILND